MQPVNTWNMCMPVMPKNVAPKRGVAPGHFSAHSCGRANGVRPSSIRCFHSIACRTINVAPRMAVAMIHLRAADNCRLAEADTANTIVKLDESSTSVMIDEKTMLG